MKICIYGAGAMGGSIAARLARLAPQRSGLEVSLVARGAHLTAIRTSGLKFRDIDHDEVYELNATDEPGELGPQDYIFVGLKAHQYADAAPGIAKLLGPKTRVITVLNGVPWWYFYGTGGQYDGMQLSLLDPGGVIWKSIGPERVIAGISYVGGAVVEPGVVHHTVGKRFVLGELDGSTSEDLKTLSDLLEACDWQVELTSEIRDQIWLKLLRNASQNPLSVATGALVSEMFADPNSISFTLDVMREIRSVGEAVGAKFPISNEAQLEDARSLGAIKTSMLQDYENGRRLELDALAGAVIEIGKMAGVPTPQLSALFSIVAQRAALKGLY